MGSVERGTSGLNAIIFATSVVGLGISGRVALAVLHDHYYGEHSSLVGNREAQMRHI